MFKVTKYPHGTFSWADLASTDAPASKKFYSELMGWAVRDIPIGEGQVYTMFEHDGETVCAMSEMQAEMQSQGIPSHWTSYITVDDVDAMVPKIKELGGQVMVDPMDVFEEGRMLVLTDPEGAVVALWQAKNHIGARLVNTPGAMSWNELSTRNPKQAMDFYGKLLGWEFQKMEGMDYHTFTNKGRMNGGVLEMDENFAGIPANWGVYFSVEDIDKTVNKAPELGGKIVIPTVDAQNMRFSVIADPTGAVCTFIQMEPEPWTEQS